MFFERIVQLMFIHRLEKRYEEAAKNARIEKELQKQNKDESILDVLNRRMKEYSNPDNSDDYSSDNDNDDDK